MKTQIKIFMLISMLLCLAACVTNKQQQIPKHGIHGMLLFGHANHLYISHLPLFSHPHNQQVIAKVEITPESSVDISDLIAEPGLITLVPEPFDLNLINNPGFKFKADLFQGHFERGGKLKFPNLSVRISAIVLSQSLHNLSAQKAVTYQLISPAESTQVQHYFRVLDSKPAADHIVAVHTDQSLPKTLSFPTINLHATEDLIAEKLNLRTDQVINLYLEINELSH